MTCNRYWNLNDTTCSGVMLMNSRTPPFPEKRPNYLFGRCHCKNNTPEKDAHMEDLLDHDPRQKLIDEKVLKGYLSEPNVSKAGRRSSVAKDVKTWLEIEMEECLIVIRPSFSFLLIYSYLDHKVVFYQFYTS